MNVYEIIEMAREAGLDWHTGWTLDDEKPNRFEAFAKLVAAKAFQNGYEKGIAGFNEAVSLERERIQKTKECCILCEQKGVCNENTKDDETNTAKILGES